MKDFYKDPTVYYVGVPVLMAIWPLWIWTQNLPTAQKDLTKWKGYMPDVNAVAGEILRLDPERLDEKATSAPELFDYTTAVGRAASLCSIPLDRCPYTSGVKTKSSKGQESQTATVTLRGMGIVQVCQFLSRLQQSWPHLECTTVDLTQDKKVVDRWDAKIGFQYFFN
jgi:hypothetical protein